MNIVQLQEQLKNFSQEQLVREMQMPSGNTPQFLVLGEIMRRQKMQQDFAAQQGGAPQSTVAEDAVAAAGVPQAGLAGMARNMAPQTDMAQNTGVVAMANGGPVKKMAEGDKIVRGGKILTEQEDGSYKDERGRTVRSVGEDLSAIPSDLARIFSTTEEPAVEDTRTWGQRNIGDPLRSFFQPIGEAAREVGQPIGEAAREVGQPVGEFLRSAGEPVGDIGRDIGAIIAESAPRVSLGDRNTTPMIYPVEEDTRPFYQPPPAPNRSGIGGVAPPDLGPAFAGPKALVGGIGDLLSTEVRVGPNGEIVTVPPKEKPSVTEEPVTAPGRADRDQQGAAAVPTAEEVAAERAAREEAAKAADTTAGAGTGGAGGAGGIAGLGGMSSYEQELMDMLNRREKAAQQDKWLALAQVGLNMMSSTQPTLLGAIGEAGVKGVEAARTARDQYDKDRLELLGAMQESRLARAAAAAKTARGAQAGGLTAAQAAKLELDMLKYGLDVKRYNEDRLSNLLAAREQIAPGGMPPQDEAGAQQFDFLNAQINAILSDQVGVDQYSGGTYDLRN